MTLLVVGDAEREVTPDRVVVAISVQTPVLGTAQEALSGAAEARRRALDHLAAHLPGSRVSDGRVTTRQEQRSVEEREPGRTETRWEVAGYTGLCQILVEDGADRAAEIVATAGSHPDAERVTPRFTVSRELERRTRDELEQEAVRDALARAAGLAAAAGATVGPIVSIGEHAPRPEPPDEGPRMYAQRALPMGADAAADILEEALGELRPEPELRTARVPVRLALVEAATA
jgi:uncharacterized protein YggE